LRLESHQGSRCNQAVVTAEKQTRRDDSSLKKEDVLGGGQQAAQLADQSGAAEVHFGGCGREFCHFRDTEPGHGHIEGVLVAKWGL